MLSMQTFIVRTHNFTFLSVLWQVEEMHTNSNLHLLTSMHAYYHFFTLLSGAILNNEDSVQVYCIGAERYKAALLFNYIQ